MRRVVVLGAGTAGTMVVNKLRRTLSRDDWQITIVDQNDNHHYQPGYLLVPFGVYRPDEIVKPRHEFFHERKMRDRVEITYVTPLEGAFTKPVSSRRLGGMLAERDIKLEGDFAIDRVDPDTRTLVSMD